MKSWQRNVLIIAFVLSFVLHAGTAFYVAFIPNHVQKNDAIEVTIIDPSKKSAPHEEKRQIVEQSDKRINDELDDKAKYMSRFNQKVLEETRAAQTGKFQNQAQQGLAPKKETTKMAKQTHETDQRQPNKKKNILTDPNSAVSLPTLAALKPQFQWDKVQLGVTNPGPQSQTDDHLKDVKTGPQTLLSSREFVYYSYYSRIKERLRLFWEPKIKEKVTRIVMSGRRIASVEERVTKLVITLDAGGKLVRVQVLEESGMRDLDDAAVEAFQSAAPFPNPPHGIVESDGTIKIRWDFILEAENFPVVEDKKVAGFHDPNF